MSFSFNFLPPEEDSKDESMSETLESNEEGTKVSSSSVVWVSELHQRFAAASSEATPHDWIPLSAARSSESNQHAIGRVLDPSTSSKYKGTDLVPGVYEGGGVVWECSVDLCNFLLSNATRVFGDVLELGCGHGLPGCLLVRHACERQYPTKVIFSDFNAFVLETTIANVALNTSQCILNSSDEEKDKLASWLSHHTAFVAGDWNCLSQQLLNSRRLPELPTTVPEDGQFDCILAAETTYSIKAALDTALFISKHLRQSGVAYIACKRYYFGVGGGSEAFRDGLRQCSSNGDLVAETVQVFDNGAGNIREILCVRYAGSVEVQQS